ncbi:MAG: DUF1080 domain-containing protein [Lentisphaeria bacterium]|nr:DUF1080 domain-containing protein [Lentisphaeria bacterium]
MQDKATRDWAISGLRGSLVGLAAGALLALALAAAAAPPPPEGAVVLFDGTDLSASWYGKGTEPPQWKVENGWAEIVPKAGSIRTRNAVGDAHWHLEWASPAAVKGNGQGRGNSGVLVQGRYEVQVLDSHGNTTYADGQAGSIYGQAPPLVNVCRPPGEWQSFDILFRAPRFQPDGSVAEPARMTVLQNGVAIHHDVVLVGPGSNKKRQLYRPHAVEQPLSLQDHGNPVRYRNIWFRPLPPAGERRDGSADLARLRAGLDSPRWPVNAPDRPQPAVVEPGSAPRPETAADLPGDAVLLADGTSPAAFRDCQVHVVWRLTGPGDPAATVWLPGGCPVHLVRGRDRLLAGDRGPLEPPPAATGEWQRTDILFRAPTPAADGMPPLPPCATVLHNGIVMHDATTFPTDAAAALPAPVRVAAGEGVEIALAWARPMDQNP